MDLDHFKGRKVLHQILLSQTPEALEQIATLYESIKEGILKVEAGPKRARAVYKLIEKHRTPTNLMASPVSCQKGCGACCYYKVSVNSEEAALLAAYAQELDLEIDRVRLKIQKDFSDQDFANADDGVARCVFLDEATSACQVYEVRPMMCRNHMVFSDPKACDRKNTAKTTVSAVGDFYPELVAAAYDDIVAEEKGFMAEKLLAIIEPRPLTFTVLPPKVGEPKEPH